MLVYLLIFGVSYGISLWICPSGLPVWRAIAGFLIALFVGWLGGVGFAVFVLTTFFDFEAKATSFSFLKYGLVWSLLGSGCGAYRSRKKLMAITPVVPKAPSALIHTRTLGNEAYAAALTEIEEGRLDKGTWARCFAEADGDEPKAKALYIKARADSISNAEVRLDAQLQTSKQESSRKSRIHSETPTVVTNMATKRKTVSSSKSGASNNQFKAGAMVFIMIAVGAGGVYQDSTKPQAVATMPVKVPAVTKASPELAESPTTVEVGVPSVDSQGWTQESTNTIDVGPWLNFDPPGTRYYRYYNRVIYRVYPPGVKPTAEPANPFGLRDSTSKVPP